MHVQRAEGAFRRHPTLLLGPKRSLRRPCMRAMYALSAIFFFTVFVLAKHNVRSVFDRLPTKSAFLKPLCFPSTNDARCGVSQLKAKRQMPVPSYLLEKLLIVVTFHWDVAKLIYLEQLLNELAAYRTHVDVLIVTDQAKAVRNVLSSMGRHAESAQTGHNLTVWQAPPDVTPPEATAEEVVEREAKYALLWAHRAAIEHQVRSASHEYSAVFYMEDDTRLSWPAVVSWAMDTEILEPLNMLRCFFRTEVGALDGRPAMLDWKEPLTLSASNVLDAESETVWPRHGQPMALSAAGGASFRKSEGLCGELALRDGSPWACAPHKWYVLPDYPFQGMWAASRAQLAAFMKHPFWKEENALRAKVPIPLGYPERSNGMNLLINIKPGLTSACAVPIVFRNQTFGEFKGIQGFRGGQVALAPVSTVEHMRNGYSAGPLRHGKLPVERALDFLQGQNSLSRTDPDIPA